MHSTLEMPDAQPLIIQILRERGILDAKKQEVFREMQGRDELLPERALVRAGLVTDHEIAQAYCEQLAIPLYEPDTEAISLDRDLSQLLPEKLCRDRLIVPVAVHGSTIDVAFVTPNEMLIVDEVQLLTGMHVHPLVAPLSVVAAPIEHLYTAGRAGDA